VCDGSRGFGPRGHHASYAVTSWLDAPSASDS
jgi:hypothetical protein